jgi:hypothetical protein
MLLAPPVGQSKKSTFVDKCCRICSRQNLAQGSKLRQRNNFDSYLEVDLPTLQKHTLR